MHGTDIFTYISMVDCYGKLVGKHTFRPMDPWMVYGLLNVTVDGWNPANHLGCIPKPCKYWDKLPTSTGAGRISAINRRINRRVSYCPLVGFPIHPLRKDRAFLSVASRMHETSEGQNVTGPVRWETSGFGPGIFEQWTKIGANLGVEPWSLHPRNLNVEGPHKKLGSIDGSDLLLGKTQGIHRCTGV